MVAQTLDSARPAAAGQGGSRLGGIAAILTGILSVLLVIYVVVTPGPQRYDPDAFYRYYADSPAGLTAAWIMLAVTAMLSAFAVIPAMADLVSPVSRDWTRSASLYGIAGYAVMAASFLTLIGTVPDLVATYAAGTDAARTAIVATGLPEIDPDGWLVFGGPATWYIVTNVLALRGRRLPRLHAAIGIVLGAGYWLTVFAGIFQIEALNLVAAGLGALLAPVWYVWLGARLLR
jgi:hypothetical protein